MGERETGVCSTKEGKERQIGLQPRRRTSKKDSTKEKNVLHGFKQGEERQKAKKGFQTPQFGIQHHFGRLSCLMTSFGLCLLYHITSFIDTHFGFVPSLFCLVYLVLFYLEVT